jgi:hypothetical protein
MTRLQRSVTAVRGIRPRRPTSRLGSAFVALLAAIFGGVMLTCAVSIGIWPGEAKLLEPLLCTDARPDAIVVYDTYSPQPGETVTNFSLYCMGPRGDVTDHGWAKVFLLLSAFHTLIFLIGFAVASIGSNGRSKDPPANPLISPS